MSVNANVALSGQTVQNQVREVGINPDYWYAVAWARDVRPGRITPIQIWNQEVALWRDSQGHIQAVEDICPHKGVAMHKGTVQGDRIVCGYHGWEFDRSGECAHIPYFPPEQKLPRACMRHFPVRERYGVIFLFPGDASLAAATPMLEIPQYDDDDWLMIPIDAQFKSHFSICNENTMDVFHGYLHKNLQGWYDPKLTRLVETAATVEADYTVSYGGILTKFLGLNDSAAATTRTISVTYQYPHYINTLQGISYLYLMRLPIGPDRSRSFSMLFVKLRLPKRIVDPLRPVLEPLIRNLLFLRFLHQDIDMIESEFGHYQKDPQRRYVEVNPAIIAVQRLMMRQYNQAQVLPVKPSEPTQNGAVSMVVTAPTAEIAIADGKIANS
jgi:renierapurpurin 18,18'-hydroxylase